MRIWHEGERAAQARAGVEARMREIGPRVLRPFISGVHAALFAELPFVVLGSVDAGAWPWASILCGPPGFVTSPNPFTLSVAAAANAADPLAGVLNVEAPLGVLGIDFATRRRARVNGRIEAVGPDGFAIRVQQSFGNCAQYIHERRFESAHVPARIRAERFERLDAEALALVARADTGFVASSNPDSGMDVSHRGGAPGFLGHAADGAVLLPDYRGNFFFNTLGNLIAYPRIGLLLVDFARGDLLQITGTTEIVWEGEALAAFAGAQRLIRIAPAHGRWLRGAFPLRFSPDGVSA